MEDPLTVASHSEVPWWRHGVCYQVYIRSFADGNADGIGDIAGLRSRLPYLADLGVDSIWVNPWYRSPLRDGGYDVADYRDIHPDYGSIPEVDALVADAHGLDLRVIGDIVPNHTSTEHPWFRQALRSPSGSPERSRYHFLPGRGPDGSRPPTSWRSLFGGPAWTRVEDGSWYLHLFDASQPDLNWSNPEVVAEFDDVLRFWLDRNLDGFRVDVAPALTKDFSAVDHSQRLEGFTVTSTHPYWDRDDLHDIVRGWRKVLDAYPGTMLVAESAVPPARLSRYVRSDEYHQAFAFHFMDAGWDAATLRALIPDTISRLAGVGALPTWVLSNHDIIRHATRFGLPDGVDAKDWLLHGPPDLLDQSLGVRRARAAALLMLGLPGSAYLYQGEELGLHEVADLPEEVLEDPIWHRSGHTEKGRDGCRVPIPWTEAGPSFGFGERGSWLPQPAWFGPLSVERQIEDPQSTLTLYRRALAIRKEFAPLDETVEMLDLGPAAVAYRRPSGFTCVVNLGSSPLQLPAPIAGAEPLLISDPSPPGWLGPNRALWARI